MSWGCGLHWRRFTKQNAYNLFSLLSSPEIVGRGVYFQTAASHQQPVVPVLLVVAVTWAFTSSLLFKGWIFSNFHSPFSSSSTPSPYCTHHRLPSPQPTPALGALWTSCGRPWISFTKIRIKCHSRAETLCKSTYIDLFIFC